MMRKKVLVATNNQGKLREFNKILGDLNIECVSLKDMGIHIEVEETGITFLENAKLKAEEIYKAAKMPTISDDSGLMVDFLNGEPGIYSARYSGENSSDEKNINKLLANMEKVPKERRTARFKSVIYFILNDETKMYSEGICEGEILTEKAGDNGFGYDPVFFVEQFQKSFAQLTDDEKNSISHRGNAIRNLRDLLKK